MKIKFCGAAREVTGSSHLLTLENGHQILLDCGLYQGDDEDLLKYNAEWPFFNPADLSFVIISHAHIDHIGRLPKLVKDGFRGEIVCTHATRSLAQTMLLDSARIQRFDAEDNGHAPLYTEKDVHKMMRFITGLSYDRWHWMEDGLKVKFTDAGHILGSASIALEINENGQYRYFGFSGDIGRPDRPILKDPQPMDEMDFLICESTYGHKKHQDNYSQLNELLYIVKKTCLLNEGKLLIPAFSLGRTQELIYLLDQLETAGKLPPVPVYVDSPLAVNATEIFRNHPECYDEELHEYMLEDPDPFGFKKLRLHRSPGLSRQLADSKEPCIIISPSGMMTSGRVRRHLYHILQDEKNCLLMVGYAPRNTIGHHLKRGRNRVYMYNEKIEVKAEVKVMDSFSAHGDKFELMAFLSNQKKVKKLFLTHGEYDVQQEFKDFLHQSGFNDVLIPALGEEFEL